MGRVFNFRSCCMHTMHLLHNVAIQPNLELKTRPKKLLGSLPLDIVLPGRLLMIIMIKVDGFKINMSKLNNLFFIFVKI
jgi:hypothetical protein